MIFELPSKIYESCFVGQHIYLYIYCYTGVHIINLLFARVALVVEYKASIKKYHYNNNITITSIKGHDFFLFEISRIGRQ